MKYVYDGLNTKRIQQKSHLWLEWNPQTGVGVPMICARRVY